MSLDRRKSEIIKAVVDDFSCYEEMLIKWERLGLTEEEFFLKIGESEETHYERKSDLPNYKSEYIDLYSRDWTLNSLIDRLNEIKDGFNTDPVLDLEMENDYYSSICYVYFNEFTTGDESDEQFSKRVRTSYRQRLTRLRNKPERDKKAREKAEKEKKEAIEAAKDLIKLLGEDEVLGLINEKPSKKNCKVKA